MIRIKSIDDHSHGKIYTVLTEGKECKILLSHHAAQRASLWKIDIAQVLEALLHPREVITGHHGRFIAHLPLNGHLIRVVYEYDDGIPIVITVYRPRKERYYRGGGIYEDRVLGRC
ncbi:DUF4258 domain-containing protein [Thermococcus sp.]